MKKWREARGERLCLVLTLLLLAVTLARGTDITRGTTFTDGSVVMAADLHSLVDDSTINAAFYTSKSTATVINDADKFLIYVPSATAYKQVPFSLVTANAGVITNRVQKTTPATNDLLLIYDITSAGLKKATIGDVVSNAWTSVVDPSTNGGVATPAVLTNAFLLTYYNGYWLTLNLQRLQNTFAANGTNLPAATNFTGNDQLSLTTTNGTTNGPIQAGLTLAALGTYFSNLNVLPTYTQARATFNGTPAFTQLSNQVDTVNNYVYVSTNFVIGFTNGQLITLMGTNTDITKFPVTTPALTTNQGYYFYKAATNSPGSVSLKLYTNRNDAVNGNTNNIVITGAGTGSNTVFAITNYSFSGGMVGQVSANGTSKRTGYYEFYFNNPSTTTNYYVLGMVQGQATGFGGFVGVGYDGPQIATNRFRFLTYASSNTFAEYPRVQISVQPE